MLFTKPIKFAEAIKSHKVKKLMPTAATSAQLQELEPQIRERARFLAQVDHAGTVAETHALIGKVLEEGMDINTARTELGAYLNSIAYDPDNPPEGFAPAKPGSIQDIASAGRRNLVLDTNIKMANGYGQFKQANDPDILDDYPCWEFLRSSQRKVPRDNWLSRWVKAGGGLYGPNNDRMIATKDDPVWTNLGPFKLPYPPFDYMSGMGVEEIDREEAEALGVIKPSTIVEPQERGFNDDLSGSVPANLSGALLTAVKSVLSVSDDGRFIP